jgi:hypothetical protein
VVFGFEAIQELILGGNPFPFQKCEKDPFLDVNKSGVWGFVKDT